MRHSAAERLGWSGQVRVTARDLQGEEIDVAVLDNTIVDAGLNLLRDQLRGARDAQILYLAVGAGAAAPANGNTQLADERFRKSVTRSAASGTGQTLTTVYLAPGECNTFTIAELGWYAHDAGTAENSGVLVARVAYARAKTSAESLQIDRTDTLARGA